MLRWSQGARLPLDAGPQRRPRGPIDGRAARPGPPPRLVPAVGRCGSAGAQRCGSAGDVLDGTAGDLVVEGEASLVKRWIGIVAVVACLAAALFATRAGAHHQDLQDPDDTRGRFDLRFVHTWGSH